MKIYCTKQEFRKLIVDCRNSTCCSDCVLNSICESNVLNEGEFIANISIISDADKIIEQSNENS